MYLKSLTFILLAGLLISCQPDKQAEKIQDKSADQLYQAAADAVPKMKMDSAFLLLRKALENDFEHPMRVVMDSNFYPLIDSAEYRPRLRSLLQEFARSNQAKMVREEEPGEAIFVRGIILDEVTRQPISGVNIELVHTDANGLYFAEKSNWNPRIFAYLLTNESGEFKVQTIRPGNYKDEDGNDTPAHIHFSLNKEGYRDYNSEFVLEDDPLFSPDNNTETLPIAKLIKADSTNLYKVNLAMQRK